MARLEAVAVGGYFKTPPHLLPRIACLLKPTFSDGKVVLMDPCAGDGEAITALARKWAPESLSLLTCEMESSRYAILRKTVKEQLGVYPTQNNTTHSDAFRLRLEDVSASVLFLNPPYDADPEFKRLEHRFLVRFTQPLITDGTLVFLVPHYALKASAAFLAENYTDIHCFRFPTEDFDVYKQVVLVANKADGVGVCQKNLDKIISWSEDASKLPELPNLTTPPLWETPTISHNHYSNYWKVQAVDLIGLCTKIKPWEQTSRKGSISPVHGVLPDIPVQDMLLRKYPVATPPRPAHIAAGIASGIFNGSRISSETPGMPDLLVKGVFDQEWRDVEAKRNKDGEIVGVVQVQQPKLVSTVLDLETYKYHTLKSGSSTKGSVEELTIAGLLHHYSGSLMHVMEEQCPILYDPRKDGDSVKLAETSRTLFKAQAHTTKALVKLLGGPGLSLQQRKGKAAFLIGEIGSGKTTVAAALSKTLGSKRTLVLCPPHLLQSWKDEVTEVLPETDLKVLETAKDVEDICKEDTKNPVIAILSRETAKLSHGWEGVGKACPKCGNPTPDTDLVKKRARCQYKEIVGSGVLFDLITPLARKIAVYDPTYSAAQTLLTKRWDRKRLAHYEKKNKKATPLFSGLPEGYLDEALSALVLRHNGRENELLEKAIVWSLHAIGDPHRIARVIEVFLSRSRHNYQYHKFGMDLMLMLPPGGEVQQELTHKYKSSMSYDHSWGSLKNKCEYLSTSEYKIAGINASWVTGVLVLSKSKPRSLGAVKATLTLITKVSSVEWSEPCGEILFQAATPRRVALAKYIQTRHPKLFDFMIFDEAHEYSSKNSAQGVSAHRLTGLGVPFIKMTGSLMNGYADSLFMNMWAVSPDFREEFSRESTQKFVDRYGYRKRLVQEKDANTKEVVEFGTMSDRAIRTERVVGNAPGVLPLFLLRHLLPCSVTLHKADLALDLLPCKQETHYIEMDPDLRYRSMSLQRALLDQIKKDMFKPELSGKLFGQLAELPSYLDRSTEDVGNNDLGTYDIRYPESVGGDLVVEQEAFDKSKISPKEEWMLDNIRQELTAGRNVLVFAWHLKVLPRLAWLIEKEVDTRAPILYANKVATGKRQDWINKNIIKKGAKVMVANPVAIQTGLNNLVHFSTEIWMENPACNPLTFRQAIGRVDRIGQRKPTRILFPLYKESLQETLHELLLQKVAVSVSTDGLDPESALLAAGIGTDEYMTGMSIGKQLWAMLSEGYVG